MSGVGAPPAGLTTPAATNRRRNKSSKKKRKKGSRKPRSAKRQRPAPVHANTVTEHSDNTPAPAKASSNGNGQTEHATQGVDDGDISMGAQDQEKEKKEEEHDEEQEEEQQQENEDEEEEEEEEEEETTSDSTDKQASDPFAKLFLDKETVTDGGSHSSGARFEQCLYPGFAPGSVYVRGVSSLPCPRAHATSLADYGVKSSLAAQWDAVRQQALSKSQRSRKRKGKATASGNSSSASLWTQPAGSLFPLLNSYHDVIYCGQTHRNAQHVEDAFLLHALNHVLRTRDRVLRNNRKLRTSEATDSLNVQDQGFARPKVLIMLPLRTSAHRVVSRLLKLLPPRFSNVMNVGRLHREYGKDRTAHEEKHIKRPDDFEFLFDGNCDDHFRLGISLAGKAVKLFSSFSSSDIIVASPLGLRTLVGLADDDESDADMDPADLDPELVGPDGKPSKKKDGGHDFLSSIEVLVLGQAHVFSMQNWAHVEHVVSLINQKPKNARDIDFSRVRQWTLAGQSQYYRQTLCFSEYNTADINHLFKKCCHNWAGVVKIRRPPTDGALSDVMSNARHIFQRVEAASVKALADARFNYFMDYVLPPIRSANQAGVLVFVPSYLDFVRVRNSFAAKRLRFCNCSEYTKTSEVSRSRSNFFHGKAKIMLMTERFHFFHRYRIRGVRSVVFYAPPENSQFYAELLSFVDTSGSTVITCYTRYDAMQVQRLVGRQRCAKMLKASKGTHMFC